MPAIGQSHKSAAAANRARLHTRARVRQTVRRPSASSVNAATNPRPTHVAQARRNARVTVRRSYTPPSADRGRTTQDFARANRYKRTNRFVRDVHFAGVQRYKNAKTAAEKRAAFGPTDVRKVPRQQRKLFHREMRAGLGNDALSKLYGNALKDTKDLVTGTPASLYLAGHATVKLAEGHPEEAQKLWKTFKNTDPIALAAQGRFKEAGKAAYNRPVSTALEFSGGEAAVGKTLGAVARHAPSSALRAAGSTERASLRLYKGSQPGEGPAIGRRYSKNIIHKGAQVAREKHARRQGRDPNVYRERTTKNLSGGRTRLAPDIGPGKHPLDDRVDRHAHAYHVASQQIVHEAERKAAKEAKQAAKAERAATKPVPRPTSRKYAKPVARGEKYDPNRGPSQKYAGVKRVPKPPKRAHKTKDQAAAAEAKKVTERNLVAVQGLHPGAVAHQAHDVLGIKKPVTMRLMSAARRRALTKEMGREPRGYTTDLGTHYHIEINPHHPGNKGPKGISNVTHYELGRAQGMDVGKHGPGPVSSHDRKAYFDNENTAHAQGVLRAHVGTDLRHPPAKLPELKFSGSPRASATEEAGAVAARLALHTHLRNAVNDFQVPPTEAGTVRTYAEALRSKGPHEARMGEELVPVNVDRLLHVPSEPPRPRSEASESLYGESANARAWREATANHQPGKWTLMPKRVVKRFIEQAQASGKHGVTQRSANQFKDVVLTTAGPVGWIARNAEDLTVRSAMEGLTPADLYRGIRVHRELGRRGRRGKMVQASTTGGGYGHAARDVGNEIENRPVKKLAKAWHAYRHGVYSIEAAIESAPQMATVGKELRTGAKVNLKGGLKGLLRATDDQVQHFATKMTTDGATEMRIAKHVEDVVGKWGKLSPQARRGLAFAPFAQWLGAATKYVLITLPTKHPVKTGIMAGINQMTTQERAALGLTQYEPLKQQAQDYQMMTIPTHVGKDKYGKVVSGPNLARGLSAGTAADALDLNVGGFLLPQASGALNAANGVSWTGEQMVYAEGTKNAGLPLSAADKRKVAVGMLMETMMPGASAFRRIVQEKGNPSMPQSTILTPEVRKRYDPKKKALVTPKGSSKAGLDKWLSSVIKTPRIYTKGAVNDINRNRITSQQLKVWNAEKPAPGKTGDKEVDAFNGGGTQRNAFGATKNPRTKNKHVDPEVEAFK